MNKSVVNTPDVFPPMHGHDNDIGYRVNRCKSSYNFSVRLQHLQISYRNYAVDQKFYLLPFHKNIKVCEFTSCKFKIMQITITSTSEQYPYNSARCIVLPSRLITKLFSQSSTHLILFAFLIAVTKSLFLFFLSLSEILVVLYLL